MCLQISSLHLAQIHNKISRADSKDLLYFWNGFFQKQLQEKLQEIKLQEMKTRLSQQQKFRQEPCGLMKTLQVSPQTTAKAIYIF